MRSLRFVILAVAIAAGAGAVALVQSELNRAQQANTAPQIIAPPPPPPAAAPKVDVLVSTRDLRMGETLRPEDLRWQPWPEESIAEAYITAERDPEAREDIVGVVVRQPFVSGEPIRDEKLLRLDRAGIMSALLREGMRAISVKIGAETTAGGFILPGDYVDVILTRQVRTTNAQGDSVDLNVTRTILKSVRVLAIDQTFADGDGGTSAIGRTATLEVTPDQSEIMALAEEEGQIQLSLRGLAELVSDESDEPIVPVPVTAYDLRTKSDIEDGEAVGAPTIITVIRGTSIQPARVGQ